MKSICLSHKEYVDGLVSAALLQNALKVKNIFLADYPSLLNVLDIVISICSKNKNFSRVFICDLGLNKKNQDVFIEKLQVLISNNIQIVYIDHHYLEDQLKDTLKKIGVRLIHNIEECTSVQIYYLCKNKLNSKYSFYASAAALTDYMESKPMASILVSKYDRTFLMLESCFLSYIISSSQKNIDFLKYVSKSISIFKLPHEIKNGFYLVKQFSDKISNALDVIEPQIIKMNNIAYLQHDLDLASSMIVNFVLGLSGKQVGIAFKLKDNINSYVLSIRGSKDCSYHLGKIVNELTSDLNGSGGGHDKACGAVIPEEKLELFLKKFDKLITN
ncbi:MAG TPA: DHHA1 domain-containing protein [Candidatus Nitrosocosmicus sp.]|nr:DHHA1 domain-containing protein [Candidatus Nitrosocosmicus sp.]